MGCTKRKKGQTFFLLFTLKWLRIKHLKKVEKQKSKISKNAIIANSQLLGKNKLISKMNQMFNNNNELSKAHINASIEINLDTSMKIYSKTSYKLG